MTTTIGAWIELEGNNFEPFDELVASRMEDGIVRAIPEALRVAMAESKEGPVELKLPWGIFEASCRVRGESANINIAFTPSPKFIAALNTDDANKAEVPPIEEPNKKFNKLFSDYTGCGHLYPDSDEGKEYIETNSIPKVVKLDDPMCEYFITSYGTMLVKLAREKCREDKIYAVEIKNHGTYEFAYSDTITVTFTADKVFKQAVKSDELAADLANL